MAGKSTIQKIYNLVFVSCRRRGLQTSELTINQEEMVYFSDWTKFYFSLHALGGEECL